MTAEAFIGAESSRHKLIRDGEEMPPEYYAEIFEDLGISPEYQEGEYE